MTTGNDANFENLIDKIAKDVDADEQEVTESAEVDDTDSIVESVEENAMGSTEDTPFNQTLHEFQKVELDPDKNKDDGSSDITPAQAVTVFEKTLEKCQHALDESEEWSDLVAIAKSKLGWAVAQQMEKILEDPTADGIEAAELNTNAVEMIYKFVGPRTDSSSKEVAQAIQDWVEEGYGDPSILGDEMEFDDDKSSDGDLVAIVKNKLGWSVADQLQSILDDPSVEGIENAELNTNAVRLIYGFVGQREDEESKEVAQAIQDWVEEGYGDPSVLESVEEADEKCGDKEVKEETVEEETLEKKVVKTDNLREAVINEGEFSWCTSDYPHAPIYSTPGHQEIVYMLDDKGNVWKESAYEGYGRFGGKDFYELLAEMNGLGSDREKGIDLAFKDNGSGEDTEGVKYPKLVTNPKLKYDEVPNPERHENQGWYEEELDDAEADYENDYEDSYGDDQDESKIKEDSKTDESVEEGLTSSDIDIYIGKASTGDGWEIVRTQAGSDEFFNLLNVGMFTFADEIEALEAARKIASAIGGNFQGKIDPRAAEEVVEEDKVEEMALSGNKYKVTAQAFDRESGKPSGDKRDETIDITSNVLFKNVKNLGDIESAYEKFWNQLNPKSKDTVKVFSVQAVEEAVEEVVEEDTVEEGLQGFVKDISIAPGNSRGSWDVLRSMKGGQSTVMFTFDEEEEALEAARKIASAIGGNFQGKIDPRAAEEDGDGDPEQAAMDRAIDNFDGVHEEEITNWDEFTDRYGFKESELDKFAQRMDYSSFRDMSQKIDPKELRDSDPEKFEDVLSEFVGLADESVVEDEVKEDAEVDETNEGVGAPGVRDGTGPAKGSAQKSVSDVG
ncbi:MAG: hypothetical protein ACTSPB_15775, partial [Candidatus Thorarchaeota archaeon]